MPDVRLVATHDIGRLPEGLSEPPRALPDDMRRAIDGHMQRVPL